MNPAGLAMIEAESADAIVGRSGLPLVAEPYREVFVVEYRIKRLRSGHGLQISSVPDGVGKALQDQSSYQIRDWYRDGPGSFSYTCSLDGGFKKEEVRVTVEWRCPLLRGPP